MKTKHFCPHCGGKEFFTTVHVMQEWLVDEAGNFIEVADDCLEVTHGPDNDNVWTCKNCGAKAVALKD